MIKKSQKHSKRHCMVVYARYPLGETRVQREAEALIRAGYEVDLIGLGMPGTPRVDTYRGVRIYNQRYLPLKFLERFFVLRKFIRYLVFLVAATFRLAYLHLRNHYDTIQVHNLPDYLVFCALVPKLMGVPVILDLHDLMPEFYASRSSKEGLGLRLVCWQERMACKFADHVITVSDNWRQSLIKRGVPPHKCSVVMNLADENVFFWPEGEGPSLPENGSFRLIYHGAIVQRYGLDLVLEAIDRLKHEIPGIHFRIIGAGEFKSALMQLAQEKQLAEYVTFDRLYLAEELPAVIGTAHIGIVPYRNDVFTDGLLPTKLMEYGALGMPVIASRTTAIAAHFNDMMVAFFEPGNIEDLVNCIRSLYEHPDELRRLASKCQTFNERYSWRRMGAEYAQTVSRLGAHQVEPSTALPAD